MTSIGPRGIWRRVHRRTAITLMPLLVPMSLSGGLLVGTMRSTRPTEY